MRTLWTQILMVLAVYLLHLADLWMQGSTGLNPFISIPVACLLLAIPYFFPDKKPVQHGDWY